MASRVERYHNRAVDDNRRVVKNKDLYDTIYEESEVYSNIEGVVEPNVTNEIDISKVKELLAKQKANDEKRLVKKDLEIPETFLEEEEENYDIKDILAQAKEETPGDHKPRKLSDFDFEGIKNRLNNVEKYTEEEQKRDIEDLKELIETIAGNNKALNEVADKDLSLDMFSDLAKTSEVSTKTSTSIKKIIAEARAKEIEEEGGATEEVEPIFNTNSMELKATDFTEDGEDVKTKMPLFLKIVLIILAISILIIFIIVGYDALKGTIL